MKGRLELRTRLQKLGEMHEIMDSMKSLAYMESRRLAGYQANQQQVLNTIRQAAADFLAFHPQPGLDIAELAPVYLLVGSERGFCGNFNESLVKRLPAGDCSIVAVGQKLHQLLADDARVVAWLDGAKVEEELGQVMTRVISTLGRLETQLGELSLAVLYHPSDAAGSTPRQVGLLPPFLEELATLADKRGAPPFPYPPRLNLAPADYFGKLVEHYLFALLDQVLCQSLMAENDQRIRHLEGAVNHLQDKTDTLRQQSNHLRQEEITEEIEVILLGVGDPDGEGREAASADRKNR